MSLAAKKNQILMNLSELEANGLVQMINDYQAIVTAIAKVSIHFGIRCNNESYHARTL